MTAVQKLSTWTTDTMDYILHEGDNLYQHIDAGHDFLLPTDLPTCVHVSNGIFSVVRGKEAFGTFTQNLPKTINILSVLCTFIQTTQTSALICLGNQSGSSTLAVLSQDSSMYIHIAEMVLECLLQMGQLYLCNSTTYKVQFHLFVN